MRRLLAIFAAGALALFFWAANYYRPQPLPPPPAPPPGHILAEIARFEDEMFSYLMFNHLSGFIEIGRAHV